MAVSELSWSEIACGLITYPTEKLNYSRSEQNRRKNGFNIYNAVISASGHLKFYIFTRFYCPSTEAGVRDDLQPLGYDIK